MVYKILLARLQQVVNKRVPAFGESFSLPGHFYDIKS